MISEIGAIYLISWIHFLNSFENNLFWVVFYDIDIFCLTNKTIVIVVRSISSLADVFEHLFKSEMLFNNHILG